MAVRLTGKILRLRKDGESLRTVCAGGMNTPIRTSRLAGKTLNPPAANTDIILTELVICSPGGSTSVIIGTFSKPPGTPMRVRFIGQTKTEYKPFGHFKKEIPASLPARGVFYLFSFSVMSARTHRSNRFSTYGAGVTRPASQSHIVAYGMP